MHVLNIALPVPLRRCFDYRAGDIPLDSLRPGMRILVPFGKHQKKVGMLTTISDQAHIDAARIKNVISVIDKQPILSKADLNLLQWTADYYHHPPVVVLSAAIRSDRWPRPTSP